MVLGAGRRSQ